VGEVYARAATALPSPDARRTRGVRANGSSPAK
jgi:hypothetical protein